MKIIKNPPVTIPEIWPMILETGFWNLQTSITFAAQEQIARFLVHYKAELFSSTLHIGSKGLSGHVNTLYVFKWFRRNRYLNTFSEQLQMWCYDGNRRGKAHLFIEPKIKWFASELPNLLLFEDSKILSPKSWAKFQVLLQVGFW